jgi:hypothetical protein
MSGLAAGVSKLVMTLTSTSLSYVVITLYDHEGDKDSPTLQGIASGSGDGSMSSSGATVPVRLSVPLCSAFSESRHSSLV